jgi:hypothetical protein
MANSEIWDGGSGADPNAIDEIRIGGTSSITTATAFDIFIDALTNCGPICPFDYSDQGVFAPAFSTLNSDITLDCVVNEDDLWVIVDSWLFEDFTFVPEEPNADFLLVEYLFASDSSDTSGNGIDGIDTNSPVYAGGQVELDGTNWIEVGFAAADVNNPFGGCESYTVAIDVNSDTGIGMIFSSARIPPNSLGGEEQPYNPDDPCDDRGYPDTHSLQIFAGGEEGEPAGSIQADRFWIAASVVEELDTAEPHRVVHTYDAESGDHILYVDAESGNVFSTGEDYPCGELVPDPNDDTVLIGNSVNIFFPIGEGVSSTFDGKLDNLQIYTYAWSEENVVYDGGITDPFPVTADDTGANLYDDGDFPDNIINFLDQAVFAPQWYAEKIFE